MDGDMKFKTCVSPSGRFVYGVHRPYFHIENYRERDKIRPLGKDTDGNDILNISNYPEKAVEEPRADVIYEVHNPFPFRGATYINSAWADGKSKKPSSITLPKPKPMSFTQSIRQSLGESADLSAVFSTLPRQILLTIASESTDPEDLVRLAKMCCTFQGEKENPTGILFENNKQGIARAVVRNHELFEALVNNPCLPATYREAMVLRPGIQGGSEIVGEYLDETSTVHVYEYLRRNSYIPWGHFAANMAEDAIRYDMADVSFKDIKGLRFLYYQRTYSRIADNLDIDGLAARKQATEEDLEDLRKIIMDRVASGQGKDLFFNATLWGWNYGFTYTAGGYNLHGSHQQIHQQFALIPRQIPRFGGYGQRADSLSTYGYGDQVHSFIKAYRQKTGQDFFTAYMTALRYNLRMDSEDQTRSSLIIFEDENVMLFVPKAQTSQWEVNLITKQPLGHILATNRAVRDSLDLAMFNVMKTLTTLGAQMVTCIEFSGRFDVSDEKQHLMYAFLPKIPYSMGAFTEAQLRYINGHYPEDFAEACRRVFP